MSTLTRHRYIALTVATGLLVLNFWAWSLLSPLATEYAKQFELTPVVVSIVVAIPVLIGSLARIVFGLLTDRYGGRAMFAVVCLLSGVSVVALAMVGSLDMLFLAAGGLGIAGAAFAIGVPYVNSWFPKHQRGFALGIFAVGNAGTAVAGLATPKLIEFAGKDTFFSGLAVLLVAAGLVMYLYGRNAPGWRPAKDGIVSRLRQVCTWKYTWRLSLLYMVTFGAFIALGLYLPILLYQSYEMTPVDAAARAAGFVLLATGVRPLGGWLSDKLGGPNVVRFAFFIIAFLAAVAAMQPPLMPVGTVAYLGMAAALGIGSGAIFAIIGHRSDAKLVGAVTGIIGAAGGMGGFFPPLIMGLSYQLFASYAAALGLLAVVAFVIFLLSKRLLH